MEELQRPRWSDLGPLQAAEQVLEDVLTDPERFGGPLCLALIRRQRPVVEPKLEEVHMKWDDVEEQLTQLKLSELRAKLVSLYTKAEASTNRITIAVQPPAWLLPQA